MAAYERVDRIESELLPVARRRLATARGALAAGGADLEEVLLTEVQIHERIAELSRQVESLSRRVATLEKIVTDQKYQLARDIDELEELERHKA